MTNIQRYMYRPFKSEREIRLIRISPGEHHDPIRGNVFHRRLDVENQPFTALSYAWGCSTKPFQMETVDGSLPLTDALHSALQHLRQKTEDVILWPDAVCINQDNEEEKSHQVRLMKEIYANAQKTSIWLGRAQDSTNTATVMIKHLAERAVKRLDNSKTTMDYFADIDPISFKTSNSETTEFSTNEVDAIAEYFARPWFTRVWVVQEVVCSKHAFCICGDNVLPWETVEFAALEIGHLCLQSKNSQVDLGAVERVMSIRMGMAQDVSLSTLLISMREFLSTDPRDKVYALLGMTQDGNPKYSPSIEITPDYTKSLPEVYRDTTRCVISIDQNLDILGDITHSESPITLNTSNFRFPSWVPRWDKPRTCGMLVRRDPDFRAAGEYSIEVGNQHNPNILAIAGQRVDKVARISLSLTAESIASTEGVLRIWKEHASILKCYPTGESVLSAFAKSIVAGRTLDGRMAATDPCHDADFAAYFGKFGCQNATLSPAEEYRVYVDALEGSSARYGAAVSMVAAERKFFTTQNGYMGLCPSASQVGDTICILYGGKLPVILRGAGKHFYFIGVSYVHGWMEGGYVEQQVKLHKPTEMFNIY